MPRLHSRHVVTQVVDKSDQRADAAREFRYGWIDAHEAIGHLGLGSTSALYRLINEHRLPFGRAGRHYRFRRCDLDQWMADGGRSVLAAARKAS